MVFITREKLYYYKVISLDLKNVGETFQRMINHIFKKQMGKNVEVHVDYLLVVPGAAPIEPEGDLLRLKEV